MRAPAAALGVLYLLERDEGCYVVEGELVELLLKACQRRGMRCSKEMVQGWLRELESVNLIRLQGRAGGEGRVLLVAKSKHIEVAFEDYEAELRNMV